MGGINASSKGVKMFLFQADLAAPINPLSLGWRNRLSRAHVPEKNPIPGVIDTFSCFYKDPCSNSCEYFGIITCQIKLPMSLPNYVTTEQ